MVYLNALIGNYLINKASVRPRMATIYELFCDIFYVNGQWLRI